MNSTVFVSKKKNCRFWVNDYILQSKSIFISDLRLSDFTVYRMCLVGT